MPDVTIRPTAKFVKAGTALAAAVFIAFEIAWYLKFQDKTYLALVGLLAFVWPAIRWFRRSYIKAVISGDRLRYEAGLASRSTRTILLSKVQDVRVDQSFGQRLWGVGDVRLENAGESGSLTIQNVDRPQQVADAILNAVQGGPATV